MCIRDSNNGVQNISEECESFDFFGQTCSDFGGNSGELRCTDQCTIDSSGCTTGTQGCQPDANEPDNASDMATAISLPFNATGQTLCGDDEDWYRIQLPMGSTYRINLDHEEADGDADIFLFSVVSTDIAVATAALNPSSEMIEYEVTGAVGTDFLLLVDNLVPQDTTNLPYTLSITEI